MEKALTSMPDPPEDEGKSEGNSARGLNPEPPPEEDLSSLLPEDPILKAVEGVRIGQTALEQALAEVSGRIASAEKRLEEIQGTTTAVANDHTALALANDEIRRLSELHWEERVIDPMVNQLFPVFDLVLGFRNARRDKVGEGKALDSAFKAIQTMLQDFLGTYGVEYFLCRAGSPFDPGAMKAVKMVPTDQEQLHNHVQACLQVGFRRGRRVLRPLSIQLWRYEKPNQPQAHSN